MHRPSREFRVLSPEALLAAYAIGIFPMADDEGVLHWLAPDPRALLPLDGFEASRSLRGVIRRGMFEIRINTSFDRVIEACANRDDGTWISGEIMDAYKQLHELGFAHSVESWRGGELSGGLYGVAIGGAFFGESMFHRETDASKVALASLVVRLQERRYLLLDVQFMTAHLRTFGAVEVPRRTYERRLKRALARPCRFVDAPDEEKAEPDA
jgi:leucyl/phenylalanyl-tRNA--protein transferase